MRLTVILLLTSLAVAGCDGEKRTDTAEMTSGETAPLVALCNDFDYSDSARLHSEEYMARTMAKIVKLLPYTDSIATTEALTVFFNGLKHDDEAMEHAERLSDLYLNSPASPVRDATLYTRLLKSMLGVDSLPEALRLRAEDRLRTVTLNYPGTIANDFEYIDRHGIKSTLHATCGEEILLIFYDPECPHCSDILKKVVESTKVNSAIREGLLTVLAIYAEGKRDVWKRSKKDMPKNWIIGYDLTGILDNDLYDLPAMPIIYLLDSDKRVILKDPDVNALLS